MRRAPLPRHCSEGASLTFSISSAWCISPVSTGISDGPEWLPKGACNLLHLGMEAAVITKPLIPPGLGVPGELWMAGAVVGYAFPLLEVITEEPPVYHTTYMTLRDPLPHRLWAALINGRWTHTTSEFGSCDLSVFTLLKLQASCKEIQLSFWRTTWGEGSWRVSGHQERKAQCPVIPSRGPNMWVKSS